MNIKKTGLNVPHISPVADGIHRPFWSVMIPTYNCADLLVQTLESVLAQDPGPDKMQIEVIDDCSTKDDPEAVVNAIGKARVKFFRKPQNEGAVANFNTCIQRSTGHWVHILHGDDLVQPRFYEKMWDLIDQNPDIGSALCCFDLIDEYNNQYNVQELEQETPGVLLNWLERIGASNRTAFAAILVKRNAYEEIGGYHPELFHTADWEMWKRLASYYPAAYQPEILASYRIHSASDSFRLVKSGANIVDARRSIKISENYLPTDKVNKMSLQARRILSSHALMLFNKALSRKDYATAFSQLREALICSPLRTVKQLTHQNLVLLFPKG